ncbi:hypothetical protein [Spartinivicinus poritis]|uniref:Uncharacterized protein n=1 Tax=Spartinivicinus poritis TaxID=2994640 RepID=A0ABT5U523_9GAMM|nr:hypothetical protein [Spartinivicinus sp. A2-2]MDE1461325.1 hypothetical protein [Spartinivicinus sp. A2-2]
MSTTTTLSTTEQWEQELQRLVKVHFAAAHQRVDVVYQQHFASLRKVLHRHWQHRKDIPRDLANIPRATWHLAKRIGGQRVDDTIKLSQKEVAISQILINELLALPQLEQMLIEHIKSHPSTEANHWDELQTLINEFTPEQAQQRLQQALSRLTLTHEGSRDMLIFFTLGLVGRSFSDKLAFGSALGLGSAAATSLYISQQSYWGALWAKWAGVPTWISVGGAIGGAVVLLAATPLVAPLTEFGVNKIRAKKFLHEVVTRVEQNILQTKPDATSVIAHIGTYIQLLPDLIQALRVIK